MDKLFIGLAVALVFWGIGDAIVRIIRAAKGTGSAPLAQKVADLETDLAGVEQDLLDARARIEVLEKIVTDGSDDLRRKIDDLG